MMRQSTLLPKLLLDDRTIDPLAKFLYVVVEVYRPESVAVLSRITGITDSRVSKLCIQLAMKGWVLKVRSRGRVTPIPAIPYAVQEQMVRDLIVAFNASPLKGEFLLRKWLDYLIASDDYLDNARPAFLKSPLTQQPLELDRHYPELRLGFEHHGPQHFGVTKQHPKVEDFNELRCRDLMKMGLCREHAVTLVIVTPADLSFDRLLKLIPDFAPRRSVDPSGPYVKALESLSAEYKASMARISIKEIQPIRAQAK